MVIVYEQKELREVAKELFDFITDVAELKRLHKQAIKVKQEATELLPSVKEDIKYLEDLRKTLVSLVENLPATDIETISGLTASIMHDLRYIAEKLKGECGKEYIKLYDMMYGYREATIDEKKTQLIKTINVCLAQLEDQAKEAIYEFKELSKKILP